MFLYSLYHEFYDRISQLNMVINKYTSYNFYTICKFVDVAEISDNTNCSVDWELRLILRIDDLKNSLRFCPSIVGRDVVG